MVGPDFSSGMERNAANFVPLSPIQFLERSALVYPDKVAVRHGERAISYREFESRCRRLASALARRGIDRGDTVA
ncbi:MAG: AMP-binding protein, partial [Pseudomonadota bacterium]|nr:AMP-binding protein [Pseudomonadota bacterium]